MKHIFYCLIFIATLLSCHALNIECDFYEEKTQNQTFFICRVQNALNITKPDTIIESSTGNHTKGRNDSMVEHIWFYSSGTINFFPKGLEKVFTNLLKITFEYVELKEIHQSDLKPFTELESLNLSGNQLEYLEKDLFKFNTKLKAFSAWHNKISYIDPQVFDHLSDLNSLWLADNVCELSDDDENRAKVLEIVEDAKENCSNFEVLLDLKLSTQEQSLINFLSNKIQTMQENNTKNTQNFHDSMKDFQKNITTNIEKIAHLLDELVEYKNLTENEKIEGFFITKYVAIFTSILVILLITIFIIYLIHECRHRKVNYYITPSNDEEELKVIEKVTKSNENKRPNLTHVKDEQKKSLKKDSLDFL